MVKARNSTYLKLAGGAAIIAAAALGALAALLLQGAPPPAQAQEIPDSQVGGGSSSTFYSWNNVQNMTIMESQATANITIARNRSGGTRTAFLSGNNNTTARFAIELRPPLPTSVGRITRVGDTTNATAIIANNMQTRIEFSGVAETVNSINLVYTRNGSDDSAFEAHRTFNLRLKFALGTRARYFSTDLAVTLQDNDDLEYEFRRNGSPVTTATVAEGSAAAFEIAEVNGRTAPVNVTLRPSAAAGVLDSGASVRTEITAGQTRTNDVGMNPDIMIVPARDGRIGPPRTVSVTLTAAGNAPFDASRATFATLMLTVTNGDQAQYGFYDPATGARARNGAITVTEGESISDRLQVFEINGNTVGGTTPVLLTVTASTTQASVSGNLTIAPGETISTGTLVISAPDNDFFTANRAVDLSLVASGGVLSGSSDYTVADLIIVVLEDDLPTFRFVSEEQNGGNVEFKLEALPGGPRRPLMGIVQFEVLLEGDESLFQAAFPTVIPSNPGDESATVEIALKNDNTFSTPPVDVGVELQPGTGYLVGSPSRAMLTVVDPDMPIVQVESPVTRMVAEGDETQGITVRLSAGSPLLAAPLEVALQIDDPHSNITAVGGGALPSSVTIPVGESSTELVVQVVDDDDYEGGVRSNATITITPPELGFYVVLETAAAATLSVLDNESAPQATLPTAPSNRVEVIESDPAAPVVQVDEARIATLMFSTNYPEGTVLSIAADARQLRLPSASVTVGQGGAVEIRLAPQSVTRVIDAVLTLTPQTPGLEALMLTVRIDNNVADVAFFADSPLVPQTGGLELGWQLWLLAFAAVALFATAVALAARRRAPH